MSSVSPLPTVTPRTQSSPERTQVVVNLSISVTIANFPQYYPNTSPDSFRPFYYTLNDGSLVALPLVDDLTVNNVFLIITGFLFTIFLRNVCKAAIYLWKGRVKKKGLLYSLFLSQLLGPVATVPMIVAQFSRAANCDIILRVTSVACGLSLSLLVTGILGVKAFRCLDNNCLVSGCLVALRTASTIVLILDVISLQGLRSLSGRCCRQSAGLSPVFVILLVSESFFICTCFLYAIWKSHRTAAVRGRMSVQLSLDNVTNSRSTEPGKESTDFIRNWRVPTDVEALHQTLQPSPLSRVASTVASIHHDGTQRMYGYDTPGNLNAETAPTWKRPSQYSSVVHLHTPAHRFWTVRMPTIADGPQFPQRVTTSFEPSISPTHSAFSGFTRYVPAMSLFREVMRDELCYTVIITAFTVVSAALTLVGVKSAGGIDSTIWVALDWALISLLVTHSFGRVIRRHENELLLLHPSSRYQDLYTDHVTAEFLRDSPQSASRMSSGARTRRFMPRYSTNNSSTHRLFHRSADSSWGGMPSSVASTGSTSHMRPPVEAELLSRTPAGGPYAVNEGVVSTMNMERMFLGPLRSQKPPEECFNDNLLGSLPPPEPPDRERGSDTLACVS